jgi:DNA-binding beta-propeller fold protein YncE
VVAAGKVFVADAVSPGVLYAIDPTQPPGALPVASSSLGSTPTGIAFDGKQLWTANQGPPGSVSIISPQSPYTVKTVTTGFSEPFGILYDGAHIWVTDATANTLLELDSSGGTMQTVLVGNTPQYPAFDGTNIWVPNFNANSITVVQASTGDIVATISMDASNQLNGPEAASFDGERVLVANFNSSSVTLFKAADLSFIANVSLGFPEESSTYPFACSDGINFWIPENNTNNVVRF